MNALVCVCILPHTSTSNDGNDNSGGHILRNPEARYHRSSDSVKTLRDAPPLRKPAVDLDAPGCTAVRGKQVVFRALRHGRDLLGLLLVVVLWVTVGEHIPTAVNAPTRNAPGDPVGVNRRVGVGGHEVNM